MAFIDVGTLGAWGEGHTIPSTKKFYPAATVRRQIDLYHKAFPAHAGSGQRRFLHTGPRHRVVRLCPRAGHGVPRRQHPGGEAAALLLPRLPGARSSGPQLPVVLESEHYGPSARSGAWGDGSLYLKAVEEYHASYASVHWYPARISEGQRELIDKINLRLGYRLQLLEASWPAEVSAASTMLVGYRWRNDGVAPCLPGGHPAITLKDEKGGIAGVFADEEFDMRALPVGEPDKAEAIGRELKKGGERLPQSARALAQFGLPPATHPEAGHL